MGFQLGGGATAAGGGMEPLTAYAIATVASAGIGALGAWLGGGDDNARKPYGGQLAARTATWLGPQMRSQLENSMKRGFASDAARLNWKMPEFTRKSGPGILAWSGTSGGRAGFQFGGGRNFSGLGSYEPYGSGEGTYANLGDTKTTPWVPPWRRGNRDVDEFIDENLTEDQEAHPGRQMQIGLRRGGGGSQGSMMRGTGAEQQGRMNEYRQVLRMRDSIASQGRLVRGAPKPGGGE